MLLSLSLCKSIMLAHIVRINSRTNKSNAHPSSEPQSKVQLQISRWQLNPRRNLATSQPRRVHCHLHRQQRDGQTGRQKGIKLERQTDRQTKRMTLISTNLALKSALSITISLAKCSSCCMLGLSRDSCAAAPLHPI